MYSISFSVHKRLFSMAVRYKSKLHGQSNFLEQAFLQWLIIIKLITCMETSWFGLDEGGPLVIENFGIS